MFDLFLMFNRMVLDYFTSALMIGVAALIFALMIGVLVLIGVVSFGVLVAAVITQFASFTSAPFVPTRNKVFLKMFEFAAIQPGDKVYDLGCGEGRFVFEAERRGADAIGIEMNIAVYLLALINKKRLGSQSTIKRGNLHKVDLKDADVVFCYLMPWAMKRLDLKFKKELKKGCKVVSHGFQLPGWETEKQCEVDGLGRSKVFLYVV